MSVLNPQDDAKALQPLIDAALSEAINGLSNKVAPALGQAISTAIDGLTITISISKKGQQ